MKKILVIALAVALSFVGSFVITQDAQAVPAFARQTGHACTTCHFNSFPAINSFGRAFKAGGYTDIGDQAKLQDEGLSLPSVLNASLITKVRYIKTDGTKNASDLANEKSGTNKGELQFPDEAALWIGGRVSENIGFALEAALGSGSDTFASFKMPIGLANLDGTHIELIPYTTDALGASFGFELLNTGAVRNVRSWEQRSSISAQQYIGTATAAEGIALAIANEMFFINASLWGPAHGTVATGLDLSNYIRAAVTPNVGGWDLGLGVQLWGGETKVGDSSVSTANAETTYKTQATAVDAQAQGEVGGMPLGVYASYAVAPKADASATSTNLFNSSTANDTTATAISAELGVLPNKVTVGAGYRVGQKNTSSNRDDNALLLGAKYMLAQNVQLQLNYESFSGNANDTASAKADGNSRITLMLFSGF
jgi:hypothetical protein